MSAKKQKKRRSHILEIQEFSDGTRPPKVHHISLLKIFFWVALLGFAVWGVLYFDPVKSLAKLTDPTLRRLEVETRQIEDNAERLKEEARVTAEELEGSKGLRREVAQMAGIDSPHNAALTEDTVSNKLSAVRHLLRIQSAHRIFKAFRDSLWERPELARELPLLHPLKNHGNVGNRFGVTHDRFTDLTLPHTGIDFVADLGDTVFAPGDGVVKSQKNNTRGMGQTLLVQHTDRVGSFYSHLESVLVSEGRTVRKGQPIALVGASGRTAGPVLHYEVRLLGEPIDPEDYWITP